MKNAFALLLLLGLAGPAIAADFQIIESNGQPLEDAFNAAAGKVRAVVLAAPT